MEVDLGLKLESISGETRGIHLTLLQYREIFLRFDAPKRQARQESSESRAYADEEHLPRIEPSP